MAVLDCVKFELAPRPGSSQVNVIKTPLAPNSKPEGIYKWLQHLAHTRNHRANQSFSHITDLTK